eukprot:GDKK01074891.1.p1 GENE.GDKK01074891.1~~GDKK01074891.1.p1  ORF type:complete len:102 (+),score=12.57 GDKK01074891.1:119-424(+)
MFTSKHFFSLHQIWNQIRSGKLKISQLNFMTYRVMKADFNLLFFLRGDESDYFFQKEHENLVAVNSYPPSTNTKCALIIIIKYTRNKENSQQKRFLSKDKI